MLRDNPSWAAAGFQPGQMVVETLRKFNIFASCGRNWTRHTSESRVMFQILATLLAQAKAPKFYLVSATGVQL